MPISDSDFAKVLNHLYLMSRDSTFDDESLAEGLIRAAAFLLALHNGTGEAAEAKAADLLGQAFDWCRRMSPKR